MRFPYMVNHNGIYYKAGEDVPMEIPEMTDNVPDGALETKAIQKAMETVSENDKPKRGRPAKAE